MATLAEGDPLIAGPVVMSTSVVAGNWLLPPAFLEGSVVEGSVVRGSVVEGSVI